MTNTEYRSLLIKNLSNLVRAATLAEMDLIFFEFYRTAEYQNQLFQKGRTTPGKIVTNCDGFTKKSKHQLWRAVDIGIIVDGKVDWSEDAGYKTLGKIWKDLGGTWGGDWPSLNDVYHFEV
jgi:peptidoglycan L-alanyl-D-glutamate endopeptidase CwlK